MNNKTEDKLETQSLKKEEEKVPEKKISDKILIWSIIFIIILLVLFFSTQFFYKTPVISTIEDLNKLNIEGKLESDKGYVYKEVYSFIKHENLWFTQLKSSSGRFEYNIALHFGPRELEDIKIEGWLDETFTNSTDIYVSLNPLGNGPYTALAVSEFTGSLIKSFGKKPIIVCDRNETEKCKTRPILTCKNKEKTIIHFKEAQKTKVLFTGNCIEIQGTGLELVRAVDRILLKWYKIMD